LGLNINERELIAVKCLIENANALLNFQPPCHLLPCTFRLRILTPNIPGRQYGDGGHTFSQPCLRFPANFRPSDSVTWRVFAYQPTSYGGAGPKCGSRTTRATDWTLDSGQCAVTELRSIGGSYACRTVDAAPSNYQPATAPLRPVYGQRQRATYTAQSGGTPVLMSGVCCIGSGQDMQRFNVHCKADCGVHFSFYVSGG